MTAMPSIQRIERRQILDEVKGIGSHLRAIQDALRNGGFLEECKECGSWHGDGYEVKQALDQLWMSLSEVETFGASDA
jgi:hypothetical protein